MLDGGIVRPPASTSFVYHQENVHITCGHVYYLGLTHLAKPFYIIYYKLIITNKMNGAELESCQVR